MRFSGLLHNNHRLVFKNNSLVAARIQLVNLI
ncbi:hypothetical protein JAMGFMIE_01991 [Rheinheimera sp. MM224]|nr:hypothetical protein JAMGFMIE_01991 [Rheinheimera sp. MM224]